MLEEQVMIIFTVPKDALYPVLDAVAKAGAGQVGNYSYCSYFSAGTGRFLPNENANPALGETLEVNEVEEYRVETWCARRDVRNVIRALRAHHPYEEPVYYLLPLLDEPDEEETP